MTKFVTIRDKIENFVTDIQRNIQLEKNVLNKYGSNDIGVGRQTAFEECLEFMEKNGLIIINANNKVDVL